MSKPEGWHYLVGKSGEVLAHNCSKCGASHIIFDGPARIFHCGRWETYEEQKPSGLLGWFNAAEELPRVRFKEVPMKRINVT